MTEVPNLLAVFGSDENLESEGTWVFPMGEAEGMPAFKIARAGGANKKYLKLQRGLMKPYSALFRKAANGMTQEVIDITMKITRQCFLETCLLDWKNVSIEKGKLLEFNAANADLLMSKAPALYDELLGQAQVAQTFNTAMSAIEDEEGN
jgi:hypothetical protein